VDLVASLPLRMGRMLVTILLLHFLRFMRGSVVVRMLVLGELERTQNLIPEDQHRMLGKGRLDPGEGVCLERLREIDPEDLGSQRCAEGAKLRFLCHHRSSMSSTSSSPTRRIRPGP